MMIEHRTIGGIDNLDPAALRDIAHRFDCLAIHFAMLAKARGRRSVSAAHAAIDAIADAFDGLDCEENRPGLNAPVTRFANVVQSVAHELSTVWPMP